MIWLKEEEILRILKKKEDQEVAVRQNGKKLLGYRLPRVICRFPLSKKITKG